MSKELNLETVTPQEYRQWLEAAVKAGELPQSELKMYHVRHENRTFNDRGEKLTRPELQKYDVREWGVDPSDKQWDYYERLRTGSDNRFEYTILYNPKEKPAQTAKQPEAEPEKEQPAPETKKGGRPKKNETIRLED